MSPKLAVARRGKAFNSFCNYFSQLSLIYSLFFDLIVGDLSLFRPLGSSVKAYFPSQIILKRKHTTKKEGEMEPVLVEAIKIELCGKVCILKI